MGIEQEGYHHRWVERRAARLSDYNEWDAAAWFSWWRDGLALWGSAYGKADRDFAFAPEIVFSDRESPSDKLRIRYIELVPVVRERMRWAATDVLQDESFDDAKGAGLILDVFGTSNIRMPSGRENIFEAPIDGMFDFIHPVINGLASERFVDSDGELMSRLGYMILDHLTKEQVVSITDKMEPLIAKIDNFRTVLSWCMARYPDNRDVCEQAFESLWRESNQDVRIDCRRAVAEDLDRHFGQQGGAGFDFAP